MAAASPQMLTANRLKDGDVLYWKAGAWVEALKDGEVFDEQAPADAALAAAQESVNGNVVVNPYLFDVRIERRHPSRERARDHPRRRTERARRSRQAGARSLAASAATQGRAQRSGEGRRCIDMTNSTRASSPSAWSSSAARSRAGFPAS